MLLLLRVFVIALLSVFGTDAFAPASSIEGVPRQTTTPRKVRSLTHLFLHPDRQKMVAKPAALLTLSFLYVISCVFASCPCYVLLLWV